MRFIVVRSAAASGDEAGGGGIDGGGAEDVDDGGGVPSVRSMETRCEAGGVGPAAADGTIEPLREGTWMLFMVAPTRRACRLLLVRLRGAPA